MDRKEQNVMGMKLALLSNVNMDFVIRLLSKQAEVWRGEGYGNELGTLMNPASSYHIFDPDVTFIVMDLMELLEHDLDPGMAKKRIGRWFGDAEGALKPEKVYYVSDAYLRGPELSVLADEGRKASLEQIWLERLQELCRARKNVRLLPCCRLVERLGEDNAFSEKMWYMGRILFGNEAQKALCGLILEKAGQERRIPKKVLLLDLDNTLWGGLAGEREHTPVELSEEHGGLAYKDLQRVILQMQKQGVLLGIVSRNNEADALEILEKHPHMVLRPDAFAARRINWAPKHENIREIAAELNLGLDSFVFWDDSPQERQLVKETLPQVAVPDFPGKKEDLARTMGEIFREYFAKPVVTEEDGARTAQYAANSARNALRETAGSFEEYLRGLEIKAVRVSPQKHMDRLVQLMNKTNQFNLTTRRYTHQQMAEMIEKAEKRVYLYSVSDRFGDNGVVAAAVADCSGEVPVLTDFVMSCRVMGKNIEYALVEDVERDLRESGFRVLRGLYVPTAKNLPAADLYLRMGYGRMEAQRSAAKGSTQAGHGGAGSSAEATCQGEAGSAEAQHRGAESSTQAGHGGAGSSVEAQRSGVRKADGDERIYEICLADVPKRLYYVKMEDGEGDGDEG